MRVASIVLFLASQTLLGLVSGQNCFENQITCGVGAECDMATDTCVCSSGLEGDPRVECVAPARCLCTALADPAFTLFDDQDIKVNLPCSMYLLKDTATGSNQCRITSLTAHPEIRQDDPTRVFVGSVTLTRPQGSRTISDAGVVPNTPINPNIDAISAAGGYDIITFFSPVCMDLRVGFNASYGAVFVDAPATYGTGPLNNIGLCGTCNGDTTDEATGSVVGGPDNLAYALTTVAAAADQVGPYAAVCGALSTTATACSSALLPAAAAFCDVYLTNPFSKCAADTISIAAVIGRFAQCIGMVCGGDLVGACAEFNDFTASLANACPIVQPPGCSP